MMTAGKPQARSTADVAYVLYVEDNLTNLTLVQRIIDKRPGVKLISAMEGRTGFDMAVEYQPSLVLLDLNLPDMQGDEVLQGIRSDPRTRTTPVVIISADASPRQIQRLRDLGAQDYLTKPFDIKRLLAILDAIVTAV